MSTESKRIYILIIATMLWIFAVPILGEKLGFIKPKPKPVVAVEEAQVPEKPAVEKAPKAAAEKAPKAADKAAKPEPAKPDIAKPEAAKPAAPVVKAAPKVERLKPEELILGSSAKESGYRLLAQLTQQGAGIETIELAHHEAEREKARNERKPLKIVQTSEGVPPSFAIESIFVRDPDAKGEGDGKTYLLANLRWDVVRDKGEVVRKLFDDQGTNEVAQEVAFQANVGNPAVTVTKTFRLRKGADGLELTLGFVSPKANRALTYRLDGPRGLPIEGEWYTSMFREVFIGSAKENGTVVETILASDVVNKQNDPVVFQTLPIKFAGVENQYFAVFLAPDPPPGVEKDRADDGTIATVVTENSKDKQKSDVSIEMTSREVKVGPDRPAQQKFRIFAGPKTIDALASYGAEDLASYRKTAWYFRIPLASTMAQSVIGPLLDKIYAFTEAVAGLFGGHRGNYGIAIILLTLTVRMILFPLSRKQAISAKKMQDLQPRMTEIKEKYKDDKERLTKEQFALFRANKVNPMGGCLLALIQLPIFVGLWQALNNSVRLRHASFLWIDNLAAPDMLFKFPFDVPFLGPYFNLLPFAVVSLMLVQMKLFTPPATTPEQEMQQKMMKGMMVFMSFMFYKVPSGLGIYFITSSTWAICERIFLPKMIKVKPPTVDEFGDERGKSGGGGGSGPNGNGSGPKPGGFRDRLRQLVEEAQKDRTVRNNADPKDANRDREWGRGGKPRPKPPGRKR
jgi:YidC/Oxa1 family membrane protein insertase